MEVQSSKVKSSCFKKFQAFETIVPIASNSSFYYLKLWFHRLETFGFKPLKLQFLTDETLVPSSETNTGTTCCEYIV